MSTSARPDVTILDHADKIAVPGDVFHEPANEYWALLWLWSGMEFLYKEARRCDEETNTRLRSAGKVGYFGSGNAPELDQTPKAFLTSAFHWYAVSACQYVKTVGAIAYRLDAARPKPQEYAQTVIREILAFRNKVAAHFAWTTRNNNDNDAERLASILPQLSFWNNSWHVGVMRVTVIHDGVTDNSKGIGPWSICKSHEQLRARYWPNDGELGGLRQPMMRGNM